MKFYLVTIIAASTLWCRIGAEAGTGTFINGEYNFCVSVRFNASAAQLAQIREAFQGGSQILADATDGQHHFGRIHLVNNKGASDAAEFWVNDGRGRANATGATYGKSGTHVQLFMESNFVGMSGDDNGNPNHFVGPEGDAYTIAHEHAHLAYGVKDEYKGSLGHAECALHSGSDSATLSFCLMDNYYTRGGNDQNPRPSPGMFSLNEFCVAGNHDPDKDTDQHAAYSNQIPSSSCWDRIAQHPKRSAVRPANLPIDTAPAPHTVDIHEEGGDLHSMLVIDRSGSMDGDRLDFAKQAARVYVNTIDLVNLLSSAEPQYGLASFSDTARLDQPLTTDGGAVKTKVNSLFASGSTNIGGGLQTGLSAITSAASRSCREIIVLLSDGDHNVGTPPSAVVPNIVRESVVVFTVGVGNGITTSGQQTLQDIANQTGGRYLSVASSFGLVGLFLQLSAEASGSGLLDNNAPFSLAPSTTTEAVVNIEPAASEAIFTLAFEDQRQLGEFKVVSPSGRIIDFSATSDADIAKVSDTNYELLRVTNPEQGQWTTRVTGSPAAAGALAQTSVLLNHDGTKLSVLIEEDNLTFPKPLFIEATLQFEGEVILNAQLTGEVTRPDGSKVKIFLVDDGTNGDRLANDGVYASTFKSFKGEGSYSINIIGHSSSQSRTVAGEDLFDFWPSNTKAVPSFTRSGSATAIVKGSGATADRLLNISTRMNVLTADNVLIGGFIVDGSSPKKVLVRAIGPSLSVSGTPVPGRMDDPNLTVYDGNGMEIASNDDWESAPELERSEIETSGLKPTDPRESAILRSLSPGAHTAIVRGKDGVSGIAMLEIFDREPTADSKFTNLSTRGFVNTGDNLMVGGAIVGGGSGAGVRALIRGLGPSLAIKGVPVAGRISDPTLEVFDANGVSIIQNDDWKTSQQSEILATGLAPINDAEAAIVMTLPSAPTTVHLRGANASTGIGLVEIFALPSTTTGP